MNYKEKMLLFFTTKHFLRKYWSYKHIFCFEKYPYGNLFKAKNRWNGHFSFSFLFYLFWTFFSSDFVRLIFCLLAKLISENIWERCWETCWVQLYINNSIQDSAQLLISIVYEIDASNFASNWILNIWWARVHCCEGKHFFLYALMTLDISKHHNIYYLYFFQLFSYEMNWK